MRVESHREGRGCPRCQDPAPQQGETEVDVNSYDSGEADEGWRMVWHSRGSVGSGRLLAQ